MFQDDVDDLETCCNCVTMRYSRAILGYDVRLYVVDQILVVCAIGVTGSIRKCNILFLFSYSLPHNFLTIVYSCLAMSRPRGIVKMFDEIYVFLSCILGKLIMYNLVFLLLAHVYCKIIVSLRFFLSIFTVFRFFF